MPSSRNSTQTDQSSATLGLSTRSRRCRSAPRARPPTWWGEHEEQPVLLIAEAQELGPQHGAAPQVEGRRGARGAQALGLGAPERRRQGRGVDERQVEIEPRRDLLEKGAAAVVERGAQRLVAA